MQLVPNFLRKRINFPRVGFQWLVAGDVLAGTANGIWIIFSSIRFFLVGTLEDIDLAMAQSQTEMSRFCDDVKEMHVSSSFN